MTVPRRALLIAGPAIAFGLAREARAHSYSIGRLRIVHPYAAPSAPGAPGAGYIRLIRNAGPAPDRLVGARTASATAIEIHAMVRDADVMRMRAVPHVDVPARGEVALRHDSQPALHLMMIGLRAPLALRDRIPVHLRFEQAGEVEVVFIVQSLKDRGQDHRH